MSFSSFDVHEMAEELQDLIGMRVNTVYQVDNDVRIKLFGKGRKDLLITKEAFYVTRYPRKAPIKRFAMLLRKYLKGLWLYGIKQVNFDRIVEFHFGYNEEVHYILVAELFGKGNVILHSHGEIIDVLRREKWKDRTLYPHKQYQYPPTRLSIDITFEEFRNLNIQSEKDLAVNFNFGNMYAREIFLRSKTSPPEDLYEAMHSFEKNPNIVKDVGVFPYDLLIYKDCEKVYFLTFTEAVDEFLKPEIVAEPEEDFIYQSQVKALEEFRAKKEVYARSAQSIYENYQLVEDILNTLKEARKKYEWEEILDKIKGSQNVAAQRILNIDYHTGKVTINVGEVITLDLNLSVNENAAYFFEMAKKMERKIEGAKKAMEKKKKEKKPEKEAEEIKFLRKREWYEKFLWFFSSENFLVLGGRDQKSNELLVKKHMEPFDLYVHADIQGAPSVVIKNGQSASEKTKEEAAVCAASYSRAWNHFGSLECYWVTPEQVTKSPPSGEYLTAGAFFIVGTKHFIKVEVEAALGVYQDKIMAGPEAAVRFHCEKYVRIGFGDEKKERLAKQISKILEYADIDEIIRALPGTGKVLKS